MNVERYLARIGHSGSARRSDETLRALHREHLLAVPFENLDIHWQRPIELSVEALFDKLVERRRGGFCYELNGLFAALLEALGFEVERLSARVMGKAGASPEFEHLALAVEGRFLVDVGFGEWSLEPLSLLSPEAQPGDGRLWRARPQDAGPDWVVESQAPGARWEAEYLFDRRAHPLEDFLPRCRFQESSPESHFTRARVCTRPTPEGRVTLAERALIIRDHAGRRELPLASEAEWARALREQFGIEAPLAPGAAP